MADTTYTNQSGVVLAEWLNPVNNAAYRGFQQVVATSSSGTFAYPLNSTLAAMQAAPLQVGGVTATQVLTLSNANQTGSVNLTGAPGSNICSMMSTPVGTPQLLSLGANTGKKAIQFNFTLPNIVSTTSGSIQTIMNLAIPGANISVGAYVPPSGGNWKMAVIINNSYVYNVAGYTGGSYQFLLEFDTTSNTLTAKLNGAVLTLSSSTYTPSTSYAVYGGVLEETSSAAGDAGKTVTLTCVSAIANMNSVDAGYTDFSGNAGTSVAMTAAFPAPPAVATNLQPILFVAPGSNGAVGSPTLQMTNPGLPTPVGNALPLTWNGGALPTNFYSLGDELVVVLNTAGTGSWAVLNTPQSYAVGMVAATATAQSTANTANTNASTALTTANTANTNASTALTTANTANTNANTALSEIAALIVGSAGKLVIGTYTLQWGTVSSTVGNGATNGVSFSFGPAATAVDFAIATFINQQGGCAVGVTTSSLSAGSVGLANLSGGTQTLSATWVVLYH